MKRTLPAELRSAINKQSHRAGLLFAELTRLRLMADAETMLAAGKTVPEIAAYLADVEATNQPNRKEEL